LPIEHLNDLHQHSSLLTDSSAFSFLANAAAAVPIDQSSSDMLQNVMDAAVSATPDEVTESIENIIEAEAEIAQDKGLWYSYINLFKLALNGIHDAIDGPLKSAGFTQTWGISIALFTATFRSLLLPLSLQQTKSSEYMKALKPYQNEIKKRIKDKDAQNRAMSKLFEDADQNPLAGCGISLAQLPVLLGLYRGIRNLALDGVLDEPFLWIPSLQGPVTAETDYRGLDWLTKNWVDGAPPLGWEATLAFCVMPILLVLGQSLTMNALQPPVDENASKEEKEQLEKTQGALKFLPLLIGFFSLQVPAGLTIYWFTTNVFTLASTLGARTYYKLNPPEIELPEYWDNMDKIDEMSSDDRRKAAKAGLSVGPTFEDMKEESMFHPVVQRQALRTVPVAASSEIPSELASWVAAGPKVDPAPAVEEESNSTVVAAA